MPVLARSARRPRRSGRARVGLETDYLPGSRPGPVRRGCCRTSRWEPAGPMFNRLRLIKTPRELELMRRLARITDRSIKDALESVQARRHRDGPGRRRDHQPVPSRGRQLQVADPRERRAQPVSQRRTRRSRTLAPGDLVRLEVFGMLDGYHTGICRTAVVAEAGRRGHEHLVEHRRVPRHHLGLHSTGSERQRPSTARSPDDSPTWAGSPMSFVGHGIGLFVHEEPYIGRYGDARDRGGHGAGHRARAAPAGQVRVPGQGHRGGRSRTAASCFPTLPTPINCSSSSERQERRNRWIWV